MHASRGAGVASQQAREDRSLNDIWADLLQMSDDCFECVMLGGSEGSAMEHDNLDLSGMDADVEESYSNAGDA